MKMLALLYVYTWHLHHTLGQVNLCIGLKLSGQILHLVSSYSFRYFRCFKNRIELICSKFQATEKLLF